MVLIYCTVNIKSFIPILYCRTQNSKLAPNYLTKAMKKTPILLIFILAVTIASAHAQFPGGGGGGGQRGGGGQFPGQRQERKVALPGTADDNTPKGNGKISGIIVDSISKKPVEFAAISIVEIKSNRPIDGTTTDEKGNFTLSKVAQGDYKLLMSFIGYKMKQLGNIKIERKTEIDLGQVVLVPDIIQLGEVSVVGQTQLIEEKVDRLVFNAEKDLSSRGGDATDIMRKVPMLSVDLDGNLSLRGSSNVRVLINNKPSTIVANSVADALKMIPADMIKSVEVITSPSARYDAEGSAGIINIVTKKSTIKGATLNLNTGVGNRGANLGLRGDLRTGKMGFNIGGWGRANYNVKSLSENLQIGNGFTTSQTTTGNNKGGFGSYSLGWDYDMNPNSSLSAGARLGTRQQLSSQVMNIFKIPTVNNAVGVSTSRNTDVKDISNTMDFNVDYLRSFSKPSQELSISTQFSRNNRTNNFDADLYSDNNAIREFIGTTGNRNLSYNQESTIQLDYQTPIGNNQMFEVGGKGILRQVNSDYTYYSTGDAQPTGIANELNYDQNVGAGYASYTLSTKNKYTFKVGARYEYTHIAADQGELPINIPAYGNLVPSVNVSKQIKGGQTLKLAYNRRLQRPGIQFLNPNVNASNPTNISKGNPELDPELTDQLEFSTSFYKNSFYVGFAAYGRLTGNSIESVRTSENGIITTTYGNIGHKENYGVNINANITFFKIWQVGGGFDSYYVYLTNNNPNPDLKSSNEGMVNSGRFYTNLTLKSGWGLQGFGMLRGRSVELQGTQSGFGFYNLGVKKDFANKKGSIGLSMENFLSNRFRMKTEIVSSTFSQSNTNYMYNRGFRVNFSYKFGKMNFTEVKMRKKKSVNNDDQKSDGGGGDSGSQPASTPGQK